MSGTFKLMSKIFGAEYITSLKKNKSQLSKNDLKIKRLYDDLSQNKVLERHFIKSPFKVIAEYGININETNLIQTDYFVAGLGIAQNANIIGNEISHARNVFNQIITNSDGQPSQDNPSPQASTPDHLADSHHSGGVHHPSGSAFDHSHDKTLTPKPQATTPDHSGDVHHPGYSAVLLPKAVSRVFFKPPPPPLFTFRKYAPS